MRTNSEIARNIGITTRVAEHQPPNQYNHVRVEILDADKRTLHSAWYSDPENYEYIINHCVLIGKIPNWNERVLIIKEMLKYMEFLREEILNELAS